MIIENPIIRPVSRGDDLESITDLIHQAYASHVDSGLRYWGTYQSVEDTTKRFASGRGLVAVLGNEYIGTITAQLPKPDSSVALYREPHVWSICQFCVAPSFKGRGYGRQLHDAALAIARSNGATQIVLDTAAPASGLIKMYESWGYELVGECDWRPLTNYVSVLMCLSL